MQRVARGFVDPEAPRGAAGVLDVVEAERLRIRSWASSAIKAVEGERDRELAALQDAAAILGRGPSVEDDAPQVSATAPRSRAQRRKGRSNPTEEALKRRESTHRYVLEQDRPVSTAEIRGALRMTTSSTAGALKRLCDEGKLQRTGIGSSTRYQAIADRQVTAEVREEPDDSSADGTPAGRILALIQDRGSASREELAQALRISPEEIQRRCGALIREEEIRMAQRNGRPVYVSLESV